MKGRRFGLRHILPFAESLLYVILWTTGSAIDTRRAEAVPQIAEPRLVYVQESIESYAWKPQQPPSFSTPTKLAICMNLPAFFAAALVCAALHRESLMWLFYTSGLLALPLWYGIGWWIDRAIGLIPASHRRRRITGTLIWTFTPLSLVALALSVFAAIVNPHRAEDWFVVALIVWSFLFVIVMVSTARRRLSLRRAET